MTSLAKQVVLAECAACEHAVVSGVACDGGREDGCRYFDPAARKVAAEIETRHRLYLIEVADLAGSDEFDAVRSET